MIVGVSVGIGIGCLLSATIIPFYYKYLINNNILSFMQILYEIVVAVVTIGITFVISFLLSAGLIFLTHNLIICLYRPYNRHRNLKIVDSESHLIAKVIVYLILGLLLLYCPILASSQIILLGYNISKAMALIIVELCIATFLIYDTVMKLMIMDVVYDDN